MAENTGIQYADNTQNFWQGCTKVSPGCKYCYMYREKERWGQDPSVVVRSKDATFNKPLHWKDPKTVFTCSWSDFFIEDADQWRDEAWKIMKQTRHLTYQIFTKRIERVSDCLPEDWDDGRGYPNVWIIVSMENQEWFDKRMVYWGTFDAMVKGISMEPLLGPIKIPDFLSHFINWIVLGGESGFGSVPEQKGVKYGYRACEEKWLEDIVAQCADFHIPIFVKQLGTHLSRTLKLKDMHGGDVNEFPEMLRVQQMPIHFIGK